MSPPPDAREWLAIQPDELPTAEALAWAVQPDCGAVVTFSGTVRDHAEGRSGVTQLEYEAYAEQAVPRLQAIADEARRRWPTLGRIGLLHRTGPLAVQETSVVVVVSSPHRPEAFDAARFCIDTLKETVPIWKREIWSEGEGETRADWGTGASDIAEVGR